MGWMYHIPSGCDVFVIEIRHTQSWHGDNEIWAIYFDGNANEWKDDYLKSFCPPKEKH